MQTSAVNMPVWWFMPVERPFAAAENFVSAGDKCQLPLLSQPPSITTTQDLPAVCAFRVSYISRRIKSANSNTCVSIYFFSFRSTEAPLLSASGSIPITTSARSGIGVGGLYSFSFFIAIISFRARVRAYVCINPPIYPPYMSTKAGNGFLHPSPPTFRCVVPRPRLVEIYQCAVVASGFWQQRVVVRFRELAQLRPRFAPRLDLFPPILDGFFFCRGRVARYSATVVFATRLVLQSSYYFFVGRPRTFAYRERRL